MTPIEIVEITALILWCHAAVLLVAWGRAVARDDMKTHVGHVVSLMGVFVPVACAFVALVFLGAIIGLPSVVVFLAVIFPLGIAIGLHLEVARLTGFVPAVQLQRLALTLAMSVAVFFWRGGL